MEYGKTFPVGFGQIYEVGGKVYSVNGKTGAVELTSEDVGALAAGELPNAIAAALLQAKESGEFDGAKGDKGDPGTPGKNGSDGAPGEDGYSPTAKVEETTDGAKITITDKTGTTEATVKNGKDGTPGTDGAPGKDGSPGKDGITPTIGDNGNWYLGTTDTGKPSRGAKGDKGDTGADGAGMDVTGATVGQIAKISAVDGNGVPTAWEAVDMPSGGSGGLTTAQKNTLDGLLKIAVYTKDASAAYAAFKSAFGISGSDAYSVTLSLTNVSSSNAATSVTAGGSYTTTLTPDDGHTLENVTVVMGGSDITATAYTDGVITISAVTGNVTITAVASASSGGELITSGLQGFFDCRTAQYDNTAAGGKTTISATQGDGVLFTWANNQISQQDTRGFAFASSRKYEYEPADGTDAADYSGALTIITLGYADTAAMGFVSTNIAPYWSFRPTYKTAAGTATAEDKYGSGSKVGYCYCVYRVDGNNLNLAMNDEYATYAGEDIDGFTAWDTAVKIGLARQTAAGMHLVAVAIYNRALTDIELTDMRAYMKTLEVSE